MWLIITKISNDTTHAGLKKFVKKGINKRWFFIPSLNQGSIKKCGILRVTNPDTKAVECHGLALVQPIKTALSTIQQLDGTLFNGNAVGVRRYIQRSSERDRRDHFTMPSVPESDERRRGDRRRTGFRIERTYQYY